MLPQTFCLRLFYCINTAKILDTYSKRLYNKMVNNCMSITVDGGV